MYFFILKFLSLLDVVFAQFMVLVVELGIFGFLQLFYLHKIERLLTEHSITSKNCTVNILIQWMSGLSIVS